MFALSLPRRGPELASGRVYLRHPRPGDYAQWARLRTESRDFLTPWEPRWSEKDLSRASWRQRLAHYRAEIDRGSGQPFLIFDAADVLLGGISLGNIRRGVAQCGQIGYWIGKPYAGQGLMLDAIKALLPFAFSKLELHRVEAACIPANTRSVRLLEKAGFEREGLMRSYLKINGVWQDHYLYARIRAEARSAGGEATSWRD